MDQTMDIDATSQLFPQDNTTGNAAEGSRLFSQTYTEENAGADYEPEMQDPVKYSDGWIDSAAANAAAENGPTPMRPPASFDVESLHMPPDITADKDLLNDFGNLAGEMNLSQEQAQKLVDLQVQNLRCQETRFKHMRNQWVEELRRDPEYGGQRFNATIKDAESVLQRFDTDGVVLQTLQATGFGDNPAVLKMLARIKQVISDDEFVSASGRAKNTKSLNEILWPDEVMGIY